MFYKSSYERHNEWYNKHFPSAESKTDLYKRNREADKDNLSVWLQDIFFSCLNPLLANKSGRWLTIGDAYGFDAQYILKSGNEALATDLNTDFLNVAKQEGIISSCSAQNAEKITFPDESFDYVLCKESYHHFPRPYMAVYEMLRVARSGIVIMEPQDPVTKMPLLQFLNNLFANNKTIMRRIWKNRFSYEPVGNFVYKVSEREFEKIAAGLGLRLVAFKKINPNFWFKGAEYVSHKNKAMLFMKTKCKKAFRDFLVRLRLVPAQTLVSVIFKTMPDNATIHNMKQEGYRLVYIPKNPYAS
ncbi:class I SAM-dependent methyltransferase [Sphingobacterium spiritivorum]|uniref:class I SAM-dependent methyltransferase n=1 Tax=Sphingobacterium spiritivorum TaxID=258 RepID=UPI003DA3BBEF